jgi:predicted ATPase
MQIKNIKVSNFKTFEEINVDLEKFNVLIGANASGKSNFINVLQFIKDVIENGLDNAISMQGGIDYIKNINIGSSKKFSIELHIDSKDEAVEFGFEKEEDTRFVGISPNEFMYKFSIEFYKNIRGYKVADEKLVVNCDFMELAKKEMKEKRKIGEGKIILTREKGKIKYDFEGNQIKKEEIFPPFFLKEEFFEEKLSPKELFIRTSLFFPFFLFGIREFFSDISIYDFDPKLSKKATLITGKTELESDGSNLAIVLKNILGYRKKKESFSNLIKDLLPFVDGITVQKLADKSLLAGLKEIYSGKKVLPAFLISDGTINITALIIALYFEEKPLIVIEEPERNIHPHLVSKVIDMMKDVSDRLQKQIIVTTHNPEVVRYAGIENILLVHRDDKGFSQISRPSEKEEVKTFLKNKMDIEELYVQNLLEW